MWVCHTCSRQGRPACAKSTARAGRFAVGGGRGLAWLVRDGSPNGGFPSFDPANMPSMDFRAPRAGSCERQVEIYNGFSPCRPAKRRISQPIARGGATSPAGRRVWALPPPAKPPNAQQRRRHPRAWVSAPVVLLRTRAYVTIRDIGGMRARQPMSCVRA